MGLTFGFYAFGILGWIKYPDKLVYTENYDRSPGDMFTFDSPLNANTAMVRCLSYLPDTSNCMSFLTILNSCMQAVYGMTIPFIVSVVLISLIHSNVLVNSQNIHHHKVPFILSLLAPCSQHTMMAPTCSTFSAALVGI